jgi:hypothetical protein
MATIAIAQHAHHAIGMEERQNLQQHKAIEEANLRSHHIQLLIAYIIAQITALYQHLFLAPPAKIPYHTSALTGKGWVLELMTGHPDRIWHNLGVNLEVF